LSDVKEISFRITATAGIDEIANIGVARVMTPSNGA